jgi:hypothetical protein
MSLHETERRKHQRPSQSPHEQERRKRQPLSLTPRELERRDRQRRQTLADNLPPLPDDHHVMTFAQWCKTAAIAERTGRRILKSGYGPAVTMLTTKLIGITRRDHRVWLLQRAQ